MEILRYVSFGRFDVYVLNIHFKQTNKPNVLTIFCFFISSHIHIYLTAMKNTRRAAATISMRPLVIRPFICTMHIRKIFGRESVKC